MKRGSPKRHRELRADPEKVREFMRKSRKPLKRSGELARSSLKRPKPKARHETEGLCACGCGQPTTVFRGKPRKYVQGHNGRGKASANRNGQWTPCAREGCERQVYLRPSELRKGRRYCSRECYEADTPPEARRDRMARAGDLYRTSRKGEKNPNYRHGKRAGVHDRAGRRRFRSGQKRCVHPDCQDPTNPDRHEHHVVYEQHVRREGGDIFDPRNALRLCTSCHSSHHRRGSRVVPLSALRDENYEFAFELLGAAADVYLRRRYAGEDPRLDAWAARVEAAAANGGTDTS